MSLKIGLACGGLATTLGGGCGAYYLLKNNNTIRDELNGKSFILIESTDDYEIAFRESKDKQEFIDLLNNIKKKKGTVISKDMTLASGGEALKRWCEINLNLSATKENIDKVFEKAKQNCVKKLFTLKDKMKKENKRIIGDLTSKFKTLNTGDTATELQKDLGFIGSTIKVLSNVDDGKGKKALTTWCNNSLEIDLKKDKEDRLWKKIDSRCLEKVIGQ